MTDAVVICSIQSEYLHANLTSFDTTGDHFASICAFSFRLSWHLFSRRRFAEEPKVKYYRTIYYALPNFRMRN